ncbi:MAG: anti-sigma regulatory factor [Clostridia bacterium]
MYEERTVTDDIIFSESFCVEKGNFETAGQASSTIKRLLKQMGVSPVITREVAIASYELELNLVIHSLGGTLSLNMFKDRLQIISDDVGPGIKDTSLAMKEGYSTAPEKVRMLGFGAGMGLPNIKRHSHELFIKSEFGVGTCIIAQYNI